MSQRDSSGVIIILYILQICVLEKTCLITLFKFLSSYGWYEVIVLLAEIMEKDHLDY